MLRMFGFDGGTPMRCAYRGITEADPGAAGIGGDGVDLTVLPRPTERGVAPGLARAHAGAWYDLLWTAPRDRVLLDGRAQAHRSPAERQRLTGVLAGGGSDTDEELEEALHVRGRMAGLVQRRALGWAGVLPMPEVIPVEERLEALPPVTLDGVLASHVALLGGADKALGFLRERQAAAVRGDRTVGIYDWTAWGRAAAQVLRALPVPVVA